MKKIIYTIIILLFPTFVLAYSEYIIPGGETIGIEINTDGIMVIGHYKVDNKYINKHIEPGDKITKINGIEIESIEHMTNLIYENIKDSEVQITYVKNNEEFETKLELSKYKETYRTGLYVKGTINGIGTLTYIDEDIYGMLGHIINESKTNEKVEIKDGRAYFTEITSFTRSANGTPGSKNAEILKDKEFGTIEKNTNYGVFGKITSEITKEKLQVGELKDLKKGEAYIYTTNINNKTELYKINIISIDQDSKEKNIYFEITDENLLNQSGGIIQGMSGSPIIQENKIYGAVTRVIVDDVKKGYGISIITMLEEGDKLR